MPERDDRQQAAQWRAAPSGRARRTLTGAWQGHACGPLLAEALLTTIEVGDAEAANLALQVLATATLAAADWRRLAQVAVRERGQLLPDREVAVFLAQRGPPAVLPTVALTAIRPGPEDADDRLLAIAALGRFDDARVPRLLERLAATGTASLEVLQATADAVAAGQDPALWRPVLVAVAHLADTDAWARWSALDGLSRLDPAGCVPWFAAACRSQGADLPEWYVPFCHQRLAALAPGVDPLAWQGELPDMAPLPGLAGRLQSRCPRIARQAMARTWRCVPRSSWRWCSGASCSAASWLRPRPARLPSGQRGRPIGNPGASKSATPGVRKKRHGWRLAGRLNGARAQFADVEARARTQPANTPATRCPPRFDAPPCNRLPAQRWVPALAPK